MKKVNVEIKGKTPLIMHKYPMVAIDGIEKMPMQEQAEYAAYRDEKTEMLCIPSANIQRMLVAGAVYVKGKGRASLQKQAAACMFITPDTVSLGVKDYGIDSRRVVIPATKGAVIRHRPRLNKWSCSFSLIYDEVLLSEKDARAIVDNGLDRVGMLDFRPEKKGPFGRAMVTKWETSDN